MKRLLLCLIICAVIIPSVFARSSDDDESESGRVFGITPGVRISIIGLEPMVAVNLSNLEIEGACAFNTGVDGKQFGYAPSVSIAYNSNPFEKGGFAAFGGEYMFLTPAYTNMLPRALNKDYDEDEIPGIHAVSLFYKGGYNFNTVVGITWRIRLPVLIAAKGETEDASFNLNITNLPGFAACFLIGVCTTSIGVKFTL